MKGIVGHGNGAPPPVQEVEITRQTVMRGVQVDARPTPDGGRQLVIVNPGAGEVISVPMSAEIARTLGGKLMGGVEVAGLGEMPGGGS